MSDDDTENAKTPSHPSGLEDVKGAYIYIYVYTIDICVCLN